MENISEHSALACFYSSVFLKVCISQCFNMSTEINMTAVFRKMELLQSLMEDHGPRAACCCALIHCSKAPSFGDVLSTCFYSRGYMQEKGLHFTNIPSGVARIHLVMS